MEQATNTAPKEAATRVRIITYVLDDDPEEIELLRPHLDAVCGADLECYNNIDAFLEAIQRGVHVALIDHNLNAGIDGIEVGQLVRQKNRWVHRILTSGTADPSVLRRATNSGFCGLLDKNDRNYYGELADLVKRLLPELQERADLLNRYLTDNDAE